MSLTKQEQEKRKQLDSGLSNQWTKEVKYLLILAVSTKFLRKTKNMLQASDYLYKHMYYMYIYQHLIHMHSFKPLVTNWNISHISFCSELFINCLPFLQHEIIFRKVESVISFFLVRGLSRITLISVLLVPSYSPIYMVLEVRKQRKVLCKCVIS